MALVRLGRQGTLGRGLKPFMHLPMSLGSAKVKLGLGSGIGRGLILLVPQAANLVRQPPLPLMLFPKIGIQLLDCAILFLVPTVVPGT